VNNSYCRFVRINPQFEAPLKVPVAPLSAGAAFGRHLFHLASFGLVMRIVLVAWSLAVGLCGAVTIARAWGVSINITPSMPIGIWIVRPVNAPIARGAIVCFCRVPRHSSTEPPRPANHRPCPDGVWPLLKPVAAIPGDWVFVDGAGVTVNGQLLPNSQRQSRPWLAAIAPGTYRVGEGELWVVSSLHPHSFDSRYFGPIRADAVRGEAIPVMVDRSWIPSGTVLPSR
jgi:conjugative transfer signal peptidase TraF